jgi:DNA-binding response OmpR family regulator
MKKILLIEDSNEINDLLNTVLSEYYEITSAYSGTEGLLHFKNTTFDLVILDIMLPGKPGDEVLKEIREISQVPIIMLTAITNKDSVTNLLLNGADDYITKPFDINELKARIIVQLRKNTVASTMNKLTYKNINLYPDTFEIGNDAETTTLKKKEFEILLLLISNPKKIFTKESLYEEIWNEVYYGDENTINVHISNLRKNIQKLDPKETYIETVWGTGYRWGAS